MSNLSYDEYMFQQEQKRVVRKTRKQGEEHKIASENTSPFVSMALGLPQAVVELTIMSFLDPNEVKSLFILLETALVNGGRASRLKITDKANVKALVEYMNRQATFMNRVIMISNMNVIYLRQILPSKRNFDALLSVPLRSKRQFDISTGPIEFLTTYLELQNKKAIIKKKEIKKSICEQAWDILDSDAGNGIVVSHTGRETPFGLILRRVVIDRSEIAEPEIIAQCEEIVRRYNVRKPSNISSGFTNAVIKIQNAFKKKEVIVASTPTKKREGAPVVTNVEDVFATALKNHQDGLKKRAEADKQKKLLVDKEKAKKALEAKGRISKKSPVNGNKGKKR